MFRFSVLCAVGKVFKPPLLLSNTSLLHRLKYRTQPFSAKPQLFTNNILDIMNTSNAAAGNEDFYKYKDLKNILRNKSMPDLMEFASKVSDLQSASIYIGHLCQRLSHLQDIRLMEMVMSDEKLAQVLSYFALDSEKNVPDTYILNLLFSLYKLNPFHCSLITDAESYIISRLDKLNEKDIVRLLEEYSRKKVSFKLTDSSIELFSKTVKRVKENYTDIKDPDNLISATYYLISLGMPDEARRITMQAFDKVSHFSARHLCNLIFLVATNKDLTMTAFQQNKIVGLLKEFSLNELRVNILNKLLFSVGVLKIYDSDLIENITSALLLAYDNQKSAISNTDLMYTLTSLANLRWKDSKLLDSTTKSLKTYALSEYPRILHALACLDYKLPDEWKYLIDKTYDNFRSLTPLQKLELVWTLIQLEAAKADQIASIINPKFIASVIPDLSNFEKSPTLQDILKIQKLQNISLAGKLNFNMQTEAMLLESYIAFIKENYYTNSLSEMLLLELSKICTSDCIDTKTIIGGYFIDALLYMNSDNSLEKLENVTPANFDKYQRICIKIQHFRDTLLNEVGPTGSFKMSLNHLTKLGFKVIVVPFQLFSSKDNNVGVRTFLKYEIDKIKVDTDN